MGIVIVRQEGRKEAGARDEDEDEAFPMMRRDFLPLRAASGVCGDVYGGGRGGWPPLLPERGALFTAWHSIFRRQQYWRRGLAARLGYKGCERSQRKPILFLRLINVYVNVNGSKYVICVQLSLTDIICKVSQ